jgi:hypothetical protein
MTEPISDAILDAMAQYGGSFVKQLAILYCLGDPDNRRILRAAFAEYFTEYAEMVKTATAQKRHFDD